MSRADEIRDLVAKARSINSSISTTLVDQYLASDASIEKIGSDLFQLVMAAHARQPGKPVLAAIPEE